MPITSHVVEEGHGRGRGHTEHGRGKGLGHQKHAEEAMADGEYTMVVSGIAHVNNAAANQTSAQTTLADGSKMNTEARQGSISVVDNAPADAGDTTALRLATDSNNGRLRLNNEYDADNRMTLGELDALSFDYFIQSSDRTNVIPTIRLVIDADGDLATTADRGELVFEYAYQSFAATTTGSWQHADLIGGDWVAWQRSFGVNRDQIVNMTKFSDWADADGFTPAGGLHFDEDSLVLGWSVAYGSGNGTGVMFIDDLTVGGVTMQFG
jgi:hypothetical protein